MKINSGLSIVENGEEFVIDESHVQAIETLRDPSTATNLALKIASPNKQYVILCDAYYHGADFVLMNEGRD